MQVFREITPLNEKDVFVILDSFNNGFDYPLHNHPEYEINLVMGISGTRIVGDVTEKYFENDLALLGPYLYHKWDGDNEGGDYRVITVQFGPDLLDTHLLHKEHFYKIRKLLEASRRGIKYKGITIQKASEIMINITKANGFRRVILFFELLEVLANSQEAVFLASEGFNTDCIQTESRRMQVAYAYILKNFGDSTVKISDVARLVNMSDSAFSHFFRKYTNKSFTQFLVDLRIGYACKLLLDTNEPVGQICFKSGFNNITNFNRLFKKYRGSTPVQFRKRYKEKNEFDWANQITPFQFLPASSSLKEQLKPEKYATHLVHT